MESYGLENADPLNRAEWRKFISRLPATRTPTAVKFNMNIIIISTDCVTDRFHKGHAKHE